MHFKSKHSRLLFAVALLTAPLTIVGGAAAQNATGGKTEQFEIDYLRFIIDHHFSALRITELAAGTDAQRNAEVTPNEGTASTPGFEHVRAKARLDELKSMARKDNRMQREEIMDAQRMLREWYGIDHKPALRPSGKRMIEMMEAAAPGEEFDRRFIEMLSQHHSMAIMPSTACQVNRKLEHQELGVYCRSVAESQIADVKQLRMLGCEKYGMCDLVPMDVTKELRQ